MLGGCWKVDEDLECVGLGVGVWVFVVDCFVCGFELVEVVGF